MGPGARGGISGCFPSVFQRIPDGTQSCLLSPLRALLHLFPAGLILPAFTLRMWATGREGEGRAREGGGGAGEGRKTRWEEKEETLNVLNEMPGKGRHSKLICKTQGSLA